MSTPRRNSFHTEALAASACRADEAARAGDAQPQRVIMAWIMRAFSYGIYPLVFGGSVVVLVIAVDRDVSYWHVGPAVIAACAAVVLALERWWPHTRAWQRNQGDTGTDILHVAGNVLVNQVSIALYGLLGTFTPAGVGVWPAHLPFAVQFLLGALVMDLGLYGVHRASHVVPWLWRLHVIHHSPRRLYWLNGQRRHLVHEVIEGSPGLLVLVLLGAPTVVVACYMAAITIHLMFQHGNIEYRAGVLRYVFAVAELHRWHHQRLYTEVQGNYGAILSVWDQLFRTALPKSGDAPLDVGMDDEADLPDDYLGQLLWPFETGGHGT
jgi:sterol desaturase/sphingolipid hydroxylase (fatty acid hydroxylase superfamily)